MSLDTVALVLFWLSFGLCVFVYLGYPAILAVMARLRPRPVRKAPIRPSVTVVVPAFNEEAEIGAKVDDTLALAYPRELLDLVVVSDGSTDATEEIVRRREGPRVRLLRRPREGKIRALAAGVAAAQGEIVVLTDANARLEPDSVARLVESFADPAVGGVCGNKRYASAAGADSTERGEGVYWRWDKLQKRLESRIGSIFAADGAFYALRRELFVPLEDPAQADDIAYSARVVLQGRRLVYEPAAVAWEPAPTEGGAELRRKVRVTNHSVRALLNLGSALWTSGFYSFELVSHKLLRHFLPFALIVLLAANALLALERPLFRWLLAAQALFYLAALAGLLLRRRPIGRWPPLAIPYFFTFVNAAALLGVLSLWRGRRHTTWQPRST